MSEFGGAAPPPRVSSRPTSRRPSTLCSLALYSPYSAAWTMAQSQIPTSRVNRIIKADKDIRLCSKEAVFLISKAAVSRPSPPV